MTSLRGFKKIGLTVFIRNESLSRKNTYRVINDINHVNSSGRLSSIYPQRGEGLRVTINPPLGIHVHTSHQYYSSERKAHSKNGCPLLNHYVTPSSTHQSHGLLWYANL